MSLTSPGENLWEDLHTAVSRRQRDHMAAVEELGKKFQIHMAAALVANEVPLEDVTLIDELRFDQLSLQDTAMGVSSQAAGQLTEVKEEE